MGKVLKTVADVVSGDTGYPDAWVETAEFAPQPELWVTFDIRYTAAQLAFWETPNDSPYFAGLLAAGAGGLFDTVSDQVAIGDSGSGLGWRTSVGSAAPPSTADAWHTIEYHYKDGDANGQQVYADGVLVVDLADGGDGSYAFVRLGQDLFNAAATADPGPDPIYFRNIKVGTSRGASDVFADDFSSGDLSAWTVTVGDISVVDDPFPSGPEGISLAFDDVTLEPNPAWTRLDDGVTRVASYSIDRGRQSETDRTDGGTATILINDVDGTLDPTNAAGPFYGKIQPLIQASISRWNPVTEDWHSRFRGFVAGYSYDFDKSQLVNRLRIDLVDIFAILAAIEMQPGQFGDAPPPSSTGQVFFDNANVDDRIIQVHDNAGIPVDFYVTFSGNVGLYEAVYSPGESPLTVIQEAADGEFPGVSNVYPDRFGRDVFHGRLAKFDPAGVIAGLDDPSLWDFHEWKAGDGAAVEASISDTAQLRGFGFERGLTKVINSASAYPLGAADADIAAQLVTDAPSIGTYGIRSWSAPNLLTKTGLLDSSDALTETKRFATYHVDNYKDPKNRPVGITFRPLPPDDPRAGPLWRLLCKADISDSITFTVASPGGGGFDHEPCFIEGIHEDVVGRIGGGVFDDVTMTLDVSPRALYDVNPFPTS